MGDEFDQDQPFLDPGHVRMNSGAPTETGAAAWEIRTNGKPVFVALAGGVESTDARPTSPGLRRRAGCAARYY